MTLPLELWIGLAVQAVTFAFFLGVAWTRIKANGREIETLRTWRHETASKLAALVVEVQDQGKRTSRAERQLNHDTTDH